MKFHPPMFLLLIIFSTENIEQIEDILRGMYPTTVKLLLLLNLLNLAYVS